MHEVLGLILSRLKLRLFKVLYVSLTCLMCSALVNGARTGSLSNKILGLSKELGHDAWSILLQWGSTIKHCECAFIQVTVKMKYSPTIQSRGA